ncbi:MAG: GTPase ObgE, partial [Elusimicrobia bacterium]|nr:GTPase ObgE [Elusimicrobiota bacterium]
MFIDKARIFVQAGSGGDGCLSFRREKYIPFGGPNGGNGGAGGDVILASDHNKTTLLDLTYSPHFKGENGGAGGSWDKSGRAGENLVISVPCGTVVYLEGKVLGDLKEKGQSLVLAKGGRGGRGNAAFKTSRNTAPRIAEKGEPGESFTLDLELKLIADVGLIGCPNAGKSTLLSRVSSARPKIADYPFTTLSPNLGVARLGERSFVVADLPGLIEGAHQGKGLGIEFLRHVERTKILVHLVDCMGFNGKTPLENFRNIQKEMRSYSPLLAKRPRIVVVTKLDCTGGADQLEKLKRRLKNENVLGISAVTGEGLAELSTEILKCLDQSADAIGVNQEEIPQKSRKFVFENEFTVQKEENGFRVKGKKVERLLAMTNFDQEEAVSRFQNILKSMGVERLL